MTKYERITFWAVITLAAAVFLYSVLPPIGLAVVVLLVIAYGVCEMVERAMCRVWRR